MPDSDALNRLRLRLQTALAPTAVLRHNPWVDPKPMRDALKAVERAFDGAGEAPAAQSMKTAVLAFLQTTRPVSFKELKYTCFGVTLPFDGVTDRLVDRKDAFQRLLNEVDGQRGESRRFRRCYQGLLQSYFAFQHREGQALSEAPESAFLSLRGYLTDRLEVVASPTGGRVPGWVLTLKEHDNLLTDKPCDRYTSEMAQGKTDLLAEVCAGLGISRESWVWQEVILAYLREICGRDDERFKKAMDNAMDLAEGKTSLTPSAGTARTVMSRVVKRYSEAAAHPELPRLRDRSVELIGNPWIRRAAWDAYVKHEPARQMVDSWLKSKIMEDFFTLLSEESGQTTDRRRLAYWLRYVPVITDMWFALGPLARRNRSPEFREVLQRMAGRRPDLDPSLGDGNNAFIMKIGHYFFIEFGAKGNACYYYREDDLPFDPNSPRLSIHHIKQRKRQSKSHMPSDTWEQAFDRLFRPLMGESLSSVSVSTSAAPHTRASPRALTPPAASTDSGRIEIGRTSASGMRWGAATAPAPTADPETGRGGTGTWPSFTPPTETTAKPVRDELTALLSNCKDRGVPYRDLRVLSAGVWVHESVSGYPNLRFRATSMGFREVTTADRKGFWLGPDVSLDKAPTEPLSPSSEMRPLRSSSPSAATLGGLVAKCRIYGVKTEDLRSRGGSLWIYTDPTTHPALVEELTRRGFKFTLKRGYWLDEKD